jgi:hypothetical protein
MYTRATLIADTQRVKLISVIEALLLLLYIINYYTSRLYEGSLKNIPTIGPRAKWSPYSSHLNDPACV